MKYAWVSILVGLWLELVDVVLARYATTVRGFDSHPEFRVFQYGKRYTVEWPNCSYGPVGKGRYEWFFILKLPSWDWRDRYSYTFCHRNRYCWHQLCLVWTDTHGWITWYQPVKD